MVITPTFVNNGKVTISKNVVLSIPTYTSGGTFTIDGGASFVVNGPFEPKANKPLIKLEIGKPTKANKKHPEEQHVGVFRVKYNLEASGTTMEIKTPSAFKPPVGASYTVLTKFEGGHTGEFII